MTLNIIALTPFKTIPKLELKSTRIKQKKTWANIRCVTSKKKNKTVIYTKILCLVAGNQILAEMFGFKNN